MAARSFIYFLYLYKCGLITFSKVMKSVAVHKMVQVRELDVRFTSLVVCVLIGTCSQ